MPMCHPVTTLLYIHTHITVAIYAELSNKNYNDITSILGIYIGEKINISI